MKRFVDEGGTDRLCYRMFEMFLLVCFGLVCAVCAGGTPPSVMMDTTTAPPTMGPSIPANLTLELDARSPAVLDSVVHFKALLKNEDGGRTKIADFRYEWTDTANHNVSSTSADFNSTFVQIYRDPLLAGQYLMTVVVYRHPNRTAENQSSAPNIVTYGNVRFDLTEYLNGQLEFYQDLKYQRFPSTFATGKILYLRCKLSDVFSEQQNPRTSYFWKLPSVPPLKTTVPSFNISQQSPVNATVGVTAVVTFNVPVPRQKRGPFDPVPPVITKTRDGSFDKLLSFKNPLSMVEVKAPKSVAIGDTLKVNVSAFGSPPTSVCWAVTEMEANFSCNPGDFSDTTQHTINITMPASGWFGVQLMVYNDVSFRKKRLSVFVYPKDAVNVPALVLPFVAVAVAVAVIAAGGVYMLRIKKKTKAEAADFSFHPSITEETRWEKFVRKLNQIRFFFAVREYPRSHAGNVNNDKWTTDSENSSYQQSVPSSYEQL